MSIRFFFVLILLIGLQLLCLSKKIIMNLTLVNAFFLLFFFTQTMFRPNRNKTVSGFFLAGRHMWWLPVSYYLREKILFSPESCPLQEHDLHSWWDVIFEGFQVSKWNNFIYLFTKGQIISECPYEIMVCPKIATKKFPRFLPWPL